MSDRVINFGPGPSALPESVLHQTSTALLNFNGTGIGIAEISHRSKEFTGFLSSVEAQIRTQLDVPSTHSILFTQGGGTGQFSAVVLNMLARHHLLFPNLSNEQRCLDYVVTGSWSKKASQEAVRLGGGTVNIVTDGRPYSKDAKSFDNIPAHSTYLDGIQFSDDSASEASFPFHLLPKNTLVPLVADYSSSFMSRPIPRLADHAIIFAGAQKNLGPSGLTILIVRQDCLVDVDAAAKLGAAPVPVMLSYKTLADNGSLYNTPPVLAVYIAGLVLERSAQLGGVKYYKEVNRRKAEKLYAVVKEGETKGLLKSKVKEGSGSWMNVVFDVVGEGKEAKFVAGAEAQGLKSIKGHRSILGIRVSLYNAITEKQTDTLIAYIRAYLAEETI
ncbi:pyridoxal phosphate-dependent transferase [Mycena floridula]|nr:pyridoxal phosphate-dependent transferase [Mycena floridula]